MFTIAPVLFKVFLLRPIDGFYDNVSYYKALNNNTRMQQM